MGGQACVFYGAAQFSKDIDLGESRTPEHLISLAQRFPEEARAQSSRRPLLGLAI